MSNLLVGGVSPNVPVVSGSLNSNGTYIPSAMSYPPHSFESSSGSKLKKTGLLALVATGLVVAGDYALNHGRNVERLVKTIKNKLEAFCNKANGAGNGMSTVQTGEQEAQKLFNMTGQNFDKTLTIGQDLSEVSKDYFSLPGKEVVNDVGVSVKNEIEKLQYNIVGQSGDITLTMRQDLNGCVEKLKPGNLNGEEIKKTSTKQHSATKSQIKVPIKMTARIDNLMKEYNIPKSNIPLIKGETEDAATFLRGLTNDQGEELTDDAILLLLKRCNVDLKASLNFSKFTAEQLKKICDKPEGAKTIDGFLSCGAGQDERVSLFYKLVEMANG